MEQTGNVTTAAPAPVTFTRGATLAAPVTKTRSSKYDGLLEEILVVAMDSPFGEWKSWTLPSLKAAERAVIPVRTMGKEEGGAEYHLRARAQQDPESESGILFVQKMPGAAPKRAKKADTAAAEPQAN
jgi:hypothetical protein